MKTITIMLVAVLLAGCESALKRQGQKEIPGSRAEQRLVAAIEYHGAIQKQSRCEETRMEIRMKLMDEKSPGKAQVFAIDLEAANERLGKAEADYNAALEKWLKVDVGDPFTGPELPVEDGEPNYGDALRGLREAIDKAHGDQSAVRKLRAMTLDEVLADFTPPKE
jgi:uncharacterized protein YceK